MPAAELVLRRLLPLAQAGLEGVSPGEFHSIHGFCASPVLYKDLVIVNNVHLGVGAQASRKAVQAGVEIPFDEGFSYDLPYADASFDRVLSSLFFHHLVLRDKTRTIVLN